jgi:hypothetical protein
LPKDRDPLAPERISNADKQKTRKAVDEVIARDREAGDMSYVDARRRYLEHCAFTLVNRVAALRAMEVRGFLPKSVIAQDAQYGGLSAWARDILEVGSHEILGQSIPVRTAEEARWQAIRAACVAASRDIAIVFDLEDEYSVVVPEPAAIKGLVVELTEKVTKDDWAADDILGWVYQYYNVPANLDYKERKKRPRYKMTADDMIVANQFYTPHWVVRVLVDNTLGRIWWESIPDLARRRLRVDDSEQAVREEEERLRRICRDTCSYLVPMPDEQRLGWWGEEAKNNSEARAVVDARKAFDAAAVKPERGPLPAPPTVAPRSWKKVRELKIIDPACGSAHFLLYVFDVLRRMYETELESDRPEASEVPDLILAENLHGIDVDLRACQLGTLNLYLKARLAFREITGRDAFQPSKLNIVCAGARITEGEERAELLASFDSTPLARELAEGILNNLSKTAEIGSLLKVREQFEPLLRRQRLIMGKPSQSLLFGNTPAHQRDFLSDRGIEELSLPQVLDRLMLFESEARPRGDVGKLLFAHEMAKSCGMVDLLTQTYDVALMNPPYGKMPEVCKDYCRGNRRKGVPAHYPDTGNNLYSAFMEKSVDLIHVDCFVGMITSQTYMNLGTFKKSRRFLNSVAPPEILCDTGYDVLDGAKVITATTVLRKQIKPSASRFCIAFRMSQEREEEKESIFSNAVLCLSEGRDHPRAFRSSVATFALLPTSVYSYWVPSRIAEIFAKHPPLDRDVAKRREAAKVADSKQGLATGDNPQFVRFFWEVSPDSIAARSEETVSGTGLIENSKSLSSNVRPWVPFTTGGWLRSFQDDLTCVINWADEGNELDSFPQSVIRNVKFYFKRGLAWHSAPQYPSNQNRMNIRFLPEGAIFSNTIHAMFITGPSLWEALGYLNSELVFYLVRVFEIRKILNGTVAHLPYPIDLDLSNVGRLARSAYQILLSERLGDECSPYFVAPTLLLSTYSLGEIKNREVQVLASQFKRPPDEEEFLADPDATAVLDRAGHRSASNDDTIRFMLDIVWERHSQVSACVDKLRSTIDRQVYSLLAIDNGRVAEGLVS